MIIYTRKIYPRLNFDVLEAYAISTSIQKDSDLKANNTDLEISKNLLQHESYRTRVYKVKDHIIVKMQKSSIQQTLGKIYRKTFLYDFVTVFSSPIL